MRLNGGLLSSENTEWLEIRRAWKKYNNKCHPEDRIDWVEFYEEHKLSGRKFKKD